jgi:hypothetical protein
LHLRGDEPYRSYGSSVDLSGIIFVVLAVAWAVYLIPKALKHHDEVARTRSIDRFSTAMRVLARREPVSRRDSRLVVTPPRPADSTRMVVPTPSTARPRPSVAARRAAARAAARRRRRILSFLLVVEGAVTTLAALALVPWWSVAVPVALTVLYLVLCRTQVRRENEASWTQDPPRPEAAEVVPRRAIRVDTAYVGSSAGRDFEEITPDEDTVALSAAAVAAGAAAGSLAEADAAAVHAEQVQAVAVTVPTEDGGSLWDPLPVTLPTYVGKEKAARTVRTINLGEPGAWTSGRSDADSRLVEEAVAVEETQAVEDQQRAVGS